jgi:hypothetical protein
MYCISAARYSPTIYRDPERKPGTYKHPSSLRKPSFANAHPRTRPTVGPPMLSSMPDNGSQQEMSLGNISNFDMRKKVANLMAVAPALPVRDLYQLLVDLEGDLPAARKQVIRASRAPSVHPPIKPEDQSTAGPSLPFSRLSHHADGDEVMVKIDPNDTFLEWVSTKQLPEISMPIANAACQRIGLGYTTPVRAQPAKDLLEAPISHQTSLKA